MPGLELALTVTDILHPMASPGFWEVIWEEDFRAPLRDLVTQVFWLATTIVLDTVVHLSLGHSFLAVWLRDLIYEVFDILILLSLCAMAFPMGLRIIRSGMRAVRKS